MRNALVLFALLLAAGGCKSKSKEGADKGKTPGAGKVQPKALDAAPARPAKPAVSSAVSKTAAFEFAVYFLPRPKADPHQVLAKVLQKHAGITMVEKVAKDMKLPAIAVKVPPINSYSPPAPEVLKRTGRGLDDKLAKAVQKTEGAFVMMFFMDGADAMRVHASALAIASEVAEATGGLLWDQETREVFMPELWSARVKASRETPQNVLPLVTTNEVSKAGTTRLVSLGMAKLGLPDIVVDKVPDASVAQARTLIRAVAQTLAEGGGLDAKGTLSVDIGALNSAAAKAALSLGKGGTGKVTVALAKVDAESGDPRNRVWQASFSGKGTPAENQAAHLLELSGASADPAGVKAPAGKPAPTKPAPTKPASTKAP